MVFDRSLPCHPCNMHGFICDADSASSKSEPHSLEIKRLEALGSTPNGL